MYGISAFLQAAKGMLGNVMTSGIAAGGPMLDDLFFAGRRFYSQHLGKHLSKPEPGFEYGHHDKMTGTGKAMHEFAGTGYWAVLGAVEAGKAGVNIAKDGLQGMWDQDPNTFQNMGSQFGDFTGGVGEMVSGLAWMRNTSRRDQVGILNSAYARRKTTGFRLTNSAIEKGDANLFVRHTGEDGIASLYNKSALRYEGASAGEWTVKPGSVAVASDAEGAALSVSKFIKKEKLYAGSLTAEGKFLGPGINTLGRGGALMVGTVIAGMAVGGAATIAGAILDDNMQHYYSAQRPFRDERQFNNPMMQMWQMSNYQSAAGAYESNGMSLSRIYHTK